MFNPNNRRQAIQPSINALALLGTTAMKVVDRNKSITIIAAHEQTLGPKVGHFKQVRNELKKLVATSKELAIRSAAEIVVLDAVTRGWNAHLQLGTSLDSEEVGITNPRTPKGTLDNAEGVMDTLRDRAEMPFAVQALSEIEAKFSSAQAAYDATQDGRSAVQLKRRELQAAAAEVQKELVKLRTVVRIALGVRSLDYQSLRLRNTRVADADDETLPETADVSPR
jgi:hypothetical protein